MVNRKAGGSTARIDSQFAINRLGMAIHCVGTQDQLFGDLMIAQALRKQVQHLDFPCGQPARKGRLERSIQPPKQTGGPGITD